MGVLVYGLYGTPLMPTTNCKARKLLQAGKAKIVNRHPFTIQLLYKTGTAIQSGNIGIDTGSQHIGVAVTVENKVMIKNEHILRSSMEKRVLIKRRAEYRRGRRYRKVRYRHPKWKIHTKRIYDKRGCWEKCKIKHVSPRPEGWLPPSIQSKTDHHIHIIQSYLKALPDSFRLVIEAARFDMARMQNPAIHGEMYQHGPQYDYENTKAYVFDRDGYTCQCCKRNGGSKRDDGSVVKLVAHHILFQSKGATNNPKYMATVCDKCHSGKAHQPGGILYDWMIKNRNFTRGLRDATMMNILRKRLWSAFPGAAFTYGNITAVDRRRLNLTKSHGNDAVAIALKDTEYQTVRDNIQSTVYKQIRKKKRSLHEATPRKGRKEPNYTAKRNSKNTVCVKEFHFWDTVKVNGKTGYICGFSGNSAYIVDIKGQYIIPKGKTYKQWSLSKLQRLHPNNGWLVA